MVYQGSSIHYTVTFTNLADVPADPTTITFKLYVPGQSGTLTKVYGVDAELRRDDVGKYSIDLKHETPGTYHYSWEGTGTVEATITGVATVDAFDAALTTADLQSQLASLQRARASGRKAVQFADRRVEYKGDDELAAAIADLERRLAATIKKPVNLVYLNSAKGV